MKNNEDAIVEYQTKQVAGNASERIRHWLFNRVIKVITENAQPRCCQLRAPKDISLYRLFATTTRTSEFFFSLEKKLQTPWWYYIWAGKVIKRAPLGCIYLNGFKRKEIIIIRNKWLAPYFLVLHRNKNGKHNQTKTWWKCRRLNNTLDHYLTAECVLFEM